MQLHYWLEAFAVEQNKRIDVPTLSRFEGRLSTKPLATKTSEPDWEWPGDQVGTAELQVADETNIPEAVHVLAHYHDNYFDCIRLFTDLREAKAKFSESEQELWEDVKQRKYSPDGSGIVKMSKYHCALVELDPVDGLFGTQDKGSTWMLLPYVLVDN